MSNSCPPKRVRLSHEAKVARSVLVHSLKQRARGVRIYAMDLELVSVALESGIIGMDEAMARLVDTDGIACLDTGCRL